MNTKFMNIYIIISFLVISINGMDTPEYLPQKEFLQELAICNQILQKKLEEIAKERPQYTVLDWQYHDVQKVFTAHELHNINVAQLALKSQISNREKLNYITGDAQWKLRKNIIRTMIGSEKIKPSTIIYQNTNPLMESVNFNDTFFTKYLLQNGATVTPEILKKASSQEMMSLLQEYKIMK